MFDLFDVRCFLVLGMFLNAVTIQLTSLNIVTRVLVKLLPVMCHADGKTSTSELFK